MQSKYKSRLDIYWDNDFSNFTIEPINYENSFCERLKKYLDNYLKEKSESKKIKEILFII